MKIAFLSHYTLNIYLFRLDLIKNLQKNGHEVFVILPKDENTHLLENQGLNLHFYNIKRQSLNPFKEIKTIFSIRRVLKGLDLDILQSFTLKPNIYSNIASLFLKHKNIAAVTGLGSLYTNNSFKTRLLRGFVESLERLCFLKTSGVIFQNNDDLAYFVSKKIISKKKAHLIAGSGVNMDYFSPENVDKNSVEILKQTLNPENKKIVLMIARAIKDKGVLEYYAAANALPKYLFIYAGGVDKGNLTSLNESFLSSQNVLYLGARTDVKELLFLCDCFVLPSYKEGLPRTLLEAASMQKAIISTDTNGCKDVVKNNFSGLLVPIKDPTSLTKAIRQILENETLSKTFAKNAYNNCKDKFATPIIVKEYMRYYEQFV